MKEDGREDLYLGTALISLYGLRLGELAKLNVIDGELFVLCYKNCIELIE